MHGRAAEVAAVGAYRGHPLRAISVSGDKPYRLAANLQPDMDAFVRTAFSAGQMMPTNDQSHALIVRAYALGTDAQAIVRICRGAGATQRHSRLRDRRPDVPN